MVSIIGSIDLDLLFELYVLLPEWQFPLTCYIYSRHHRESGSLKSLASWTICPVHSN